MKTDKTTPGHKQQKPLRLWPAIVIVALQWLIRFGLTAVTSSDLAMQVGILTGVAGGFILIIWWGFFSRARWFERLGAIGLMIAALFITAQFVDISIQTSNMGLMFIFFSVPVLSLAFVIWAVATRNLSNKIRRVTMVATILVATGFWVFLRTDGMDGSNHQELVWRWAKTSEERFLAQSNSKLKPVSPDSAAMAAKAEWPGFRGSNRDGMITAVQIATDWVKSPPVEMWRRSVGPGCSSFAIHGTLLFTQEQRGEYEMVTCYNLKTGEPVWSHGDSTRFWDSHAGAGPRATPTLSNGLVYTLGGTGILNVLDERDGRVIWSRNAASDADVKVLPWGFAGSPLVVGNRVIISLSGKLVGYDIATGKPAWFANDGGGSYSSPHLVTIAGVQQVLLMSKTGALSVEPEGGKPLWKYDWEMQDRILQPAVIGDGDLLIVGETQAIRRIKVTNDQGNWKAKEVWTSEKMKLNFNDFIIHKEFAYGFDGPSIACIDTRDGSRKWKGSPYRGFIVLLAEQDLILVLTEKGDLALVSATPGQFRELARIPAIKGKTWNHPVMVGDIVVVRNAQEMAAFRLPTL
ncbi:MAG: PQQ-binding-like beta-propeller repeat protein [Bacteroidales bacterium]|jgi:outer membrane protein assembly factor BamB